MPEFANFVQDKRTDNNFLTGTPNIEVAQYEQAAVIRMKNGKTNHLNHDFIKELYRTLARALNEPLVNVVVLSSGLRFVFCSGLDLTEKIGCTTKEKIPNALMRQCQMFFALSNQIANSPKPVIAAINGITIGLGVQLAAVCDVRISSELAWFSIPEMKIGGVYPTIPLVQHIGLDNTRELLFHGGKVDSEEALRMGLVNRKVSHRTVEQEAIEYAKKMQMIDPVALYAQRKLLFKEMDVRMREEQRAISLQQKELLQREKVIDFLYRLKENGNIMKLDASNE